MSEKILLKTTKIFMKAWKIQGIKMLCGNIILTQILQNKK